VDTGDLRQQGENGTAGANHTVKRGDFLNNALDRANKQQGI
jgi:hypothetical protein